MVAVVRIHHPTLTPEERAFQMEQLKKALIEFHTEAMRNKVKKEKEK